MSILAGADWQWSWNYHPTGVRHHFGDALAIDVVRVLLCCVAAYECMVFGRLMLENRRRGNLLPGESQLMAGAIFGLLYVGYTEVRVLGTPATPRIVFGLCFIAGTAVGQWRLRHHQVTNTVNPPKRRKSDQPTV